MTTSYNAIAVVPIAPAPDRAANWVEQLEGYSPVVSRTDRGYSEIVISYPADSLHQAISTGRSLLWSVGGYLEPGTFRVLTSEEYDREVEAIELAPLPSLVSVSDAADMLDVARQRVQQLIDAGSLRAVKAGNTWAIPRYEVEQLAAARRAAIAADDVVLPGDS